MTKVAWDPRRRNMAKAKEPEDKWVYTYTLKAGVSTRGHVSKLGNGWTSPKIGRLPQVDHRKTQVQWVKKSKNDKNFQKISELTLEFKETQRRVN